MSSPSSVYQGHREAILCLEPHRRTARVHKVTNRASRVDIAIDEVGASHRYARRKDPPISLRDADTSIA